MAEPSARSTSRDTVFFVLSGFFLTNAILGELTGGKLFTLPAFELGPATMPSVTLSIGVLPWPVVFVTTDLVNEYYGKDGVRRLTWLAAAMITYAFLVLYLALLVPAASFSPVSHQAFAAVFGQSMWIIAGSITAFLASQFVDVLVFAAVRKRTGDRYLWLRATGSTAISQLVDTFIVGFIAFVVPGKLAFGTFLGLAAGSYGYKLAIAVLITPVIYLAHGVINRARRRAAVP